MATFQQVQAWRHVCLGPEILADRTGRNHRFLEDALEAIHACGCFQSEAHQLADQATPSRRCSNASESFCGYSRSCPASA